MKKEYMEIIKRANSMGLIEPDADYKSIIMDITSADLNFNMRLREWLNADKFNFAHDFCGIRNNIVRDRFPATDYNFFIPRFAKINESIS